MTPTVPAAVPSAGDAPGCVVVRGLGCGAVAGMLVGGVVGTCLWPGLLTVAGGLCGLAVGATIGVLNAAVLVPALRCHASKSDARVVAAAVSGLCAVAGAMPLSRLLAMPYLACVALFGGVCMAIGVLLAPAVAVGIQPRRDARRALPQDVLTRSAVWGVAAGGIVGAITGLVVGLVSYPPTAWAAAIEAGFLGGAAGGMIGTMIGVGRVGVGWQTRRR